MNVEITRFRVKEGKSDRVDEWMAFLNDHLDEVLTTLKGEKMYVETIFLEILNGEDHLYGYSLQGTGGQAVEESKHWIDKQHLAFWEECIDPTYEAKDLETEVVMIPKKIRDCMEK